MRHLEKLEDPGDGAFCGFGVIVWHFSRFSSSG
jgi:hypothetical protein